MDTDDYSNTPFRFWPALGLVVLLLLGLVGASYYVTRNNNAFPSPGPEIGIGGGPDDSFSSPIGSVLPQDQISGNLYGQTLSLSGIVTSTIGPRMFLLRRGAGADDTILIITRDNLQTPRGRSEESPIIAGDSVNVTGTLKPFIVTDIERDLGFNFDQEIEAEFENQPVVVAESVDITTENEPFQ